MRLLLGEGLPVVEEQRQEALKLILAGAVRVHKEHGHDLTVVAGGGLRDFTGFLNGGPDSKDGEQPVPPLLDNSLPVGVLVPRHPSKCRLGVGPGSRELLKALGDLAIIDADSLPELRVLDRFHDERGLVLITGERLQTKCVLNLGALRLRALFLVAWETAHVFFDIKLIYKGAQRKAF